MDIDQLLASRGGILNKAQWTEAGISPHYLREAVRQGRVSRIRHGWIAAPTAPAALVQAIRVGGFLTCIPALRLQGVWCIDDERLHVRVDRHANNLASPTCRGVPLGDPTARGVIIHRSYSSDWVRADFAIDSVESALMHAAVCQSRDNAVVVFDSALNLKLVSRRRLEQVASQLTDKHRQVISLADAAAQSGLETKARLRLRALGIRYRTQVHFDGVGRVDLVVGDRLVLELDGREWHSTEEAFAEDRRRDLILNEQGCHVIRLTYAQVMFEWQRVETLIRELVSRHEHRWTPRHRRAGLALIIDQSSALVRSSELFALD
ncbi:type IV toxin-antitoxin system AbiEi family antitoxin domain-containing protein [Subtercola frigoramans]|uniref:Very-short-patch-repair endonuclease n=1 Tax=Subtercola frigoramans TaxID=120298 RepID=A0ABS2L8S0_9MICO|nr:type IV toxin-antitoxin system AbiEi family antitoxin domain-containing protein [Subtercola frigoramans]MBM7472846.1 very-short-patch-repair endonuclease [Subtercola frigoramans]